MSGAELPAALDVVPVGGLAVRGDPVPTAGSWSAQGDGARFAPRFPPVPGSVHVVLERLAGGGRRELARAAVPLADVAPSTRVVALDPGCAQVPENLLRFSVTFSAAVEEGSAAGHVHLRDAGGAELPGALLGMPPELWDRPRRRLTVLLDPGRVKRGLRPHVEAGPPLVAGTGVTFAVDAGVRDAAGAPLAAGAERSYLVGPPVRSRVDPARWVVRWPGTGTGPLVVGFGRALDRALVRRCLRVLDADGAAVPGRASLAAGAAVWTFTPATPGGGYHLLVDTDLEDLAGNSVRRVFDRDLTGPPDDDPAVAALVLTPDGRVLSAGSAASAPDRDRPRART